MNDHLDPVQDPIHDLRIGKPDPEQDPVQHLNQTSNPDPVQKPGHELSQVIGNPDPVQDPGHDLSQTMIGHLALNQKCQAMIGHLDPVHEYHGHALAKMMQRRQ